MHSLYDSPAEHIRTVKQEDKPLQLRRIGIIDMSAYGFRPAPQINSDFKGALIY